MSPTLRLLHLYPDAMNLYGDRGNVLAFYQRMAWRGLELEILHAKPGEWQPAWSDADIVFMGGGQDAQQMTVVDDLHRHKADALKHLASEGVQFLTVCGGYQFLGHYYRPHTGEELKGLGILDAYTVAGNTRFIGNVALECDMPEGVKSLVGFENHSGKTYLGEGVKPLGRVLYGVGNNGEDPHEGAVQDNIIGTYLHGALLPRNPWLTDAILSKAMVRRHGQHGLEQFLPLDDPLALKAHDEALCVAKSKSAR
jgi:lipid II isoglutaminyl synthase (glutamine-hydrolysing)